MRIFPALFLVPIIPGSRAATIFVRTSLSIGRPWRREWQSLSFGKLLGPWLPWEALIRGVPLWLDVCAAITSMYSTVRVGVTRSNSGVGGMAHVGVVEELGH